MPREVQIEAGWKDILAEEFKKDYFQGIRSFLIKEKKAGKTIYPPGNLIFNAFNSTPFDQVKVVIIGQDPYHGPRQAMGLCFSVPKNINPPPSLKNIFKELNRDLNVPVADHGDLTSWAKQGVFLLNASLTVEQSRPGSHARIGWQNFTDTVIEKLSELKSGLVFLLWGNFAKGKRPLINEMKHFVLDAVHPSPLAGNRFIGNSHFSKTNELLLKQGKTPINWYTGSDF